MFIYVKTKKKNFNFILIYVKNIKINLKKKFLIHVNFMLIYVNITDRRTDRQTDRQTHQKYSSEPHKKKTRKVETSGGGVFKDTQLLRFSWLIGKLANLGLILANKTQLSRIKTLKFISVFTSSGIAVMPWNERSIVVRDSSVNMDLGRPHGSSLE